MYYPPLTVAAPNTVSGCSSERGVRRRNEEGYKRGYSQVQGQCQGIWCVGGNPVGSDLICHRYTAKCSSSVRAQKPENWITSIRSHKCNSLVCKNLFHTLALHLFSLH